MEEDEYQVTWRYDDASKSFITSNNWYELGVEDVSNPKELLGWIMHLTPKLWFTKKCLVSFIEVVASYYKWNHLGMFCLEAFPRPKLMEESE